MSAQPKPPRCTCGNTGACGFCPSIGVTAAAEARPYTDPSWSGRLGPVSPVHGSTSRRAA